MFQLENIALPEDGVLSNRIRVLKNLGMLPCDVAHDLDPEGQGKTLI
ncbi:MAG: hypothetical protein FWG10_11515 [Eubacteriaceae bacterium]|nr:hypothetical protein [Eubacteriaceae bacterium]